MSTVRMCDKCGKIFSENAEGWQTFTGSSMTTDEFGRRIPRTVQMDLCPADAQGPGTFTVDVRQVESGTPMIHKSGKAVRETEERPW